MRIEVAWLEALADEPAFQALPSLSDRARALLEAAAAIIYLVALFRIPFAIANAVNLATPLILTVLAVVILKEDVRWRRWTAVSIGFLGVLLVIQPHPGQLNAWAWVALCGTLIGCFRDIIVRFLPAGIPTLVVSFSTALMVGLVSGLLAVAEGWHRGPKTDPWVRTSVTGLKDVLNPLKGNDKIVVLIKIDREAKFNNMVSIIDQLDIAKLDRFSIIEIPANEKAEVEKL